MNNFSMLPNSKICYNNIELNSFCNSVSRLCVGTVFHLKDNLFSLFKITCKQRNAYQKMSSTIYTFILCVVNQSFAWEAIIYATRYKGFRFPFLLKVPKLRPREARPHGTNNSFRFIEVVHWELRTFVVIFNRSVYDVLFVLKLTDIVHFMWQNIVWGGL